MQRNPVLFHIGNHIYICQDVHNINDDDIIKIMNDFIYPFGPNGHNLCVTGNIDCIKDCILSLKKDPYLPVLCQQKVWSYLNEIETQRFNPKKNQKNQNMKEAKYDGSESDGDETDDEDLSLFYSNYGIDKLIDGVDIINSDEPNIEYKTKLFTSNPKYSKGFSEIVGIDGGTVFSGSMKFN
jgi:hypothetical protein